MYNQPILPLTAGGAAITGMNGIWWLLASFALLAAGTAVIRIVPRKTDLTETP